MSLATASAVTEVTNISRRAQLIIWLQGFTKRNLAQDPPQDSDGLVVNIGVGASNLDRFIRPWVNERFRVPDGKDRLVSGALKAATFKQLCEHAGA